jgi:hypothetical protein
VLGLWSWDARANRIVSLGTCVQLHYFNVLVAMSFRNYDLFALTKRTRHLAMSLLILPECSYSRSSAIRTLSPLI